MRTRARLREGRARLGLGGRPSRLVVRLDDLDAAGPVPAQTLSIDSWFDAIVRVVEWTGALPVQVVARADHEHLPDIVRFAHRLECPTSLRTTAAGLTQARADELVDCGLEQAFVRVAGVSEEAQAAVLGESVADTRRAIAALLAARRGRGAALDIVLEAPFDVRSAPELRSLYEEARAVGVDGVRVAAPWRGGPFSAGALEALAWVAEQAAPFNRTSAATAAAVAKMGGDGPGARREGGACPVGALQVELLPDGTARSCPFKGEATPVGDAMAPAWKALQPHRDAIKRCDRACAHPQVSA